jgi:hypothetical protein
MADYQKGEYQAEIYLLMELTIQYGCDGLLFFITILLVTKKCSQSRNSIPEEIILPAHHEAKRSCIWLILG